jgi:hypothetical protein
LGIQLLFPLLLQLRDVRGVGKAGKYSLSGPLLHLRGPSHLTTIIVGFEAGDRPCAPLSLCTVYYSLLTSFPMLGKKKEGRKKEKARKNENRKKYQDLEGVAFTSSLNHGGAGLDCFHCYARPPAKPHDTLVYGSSGARGLSCRGGPCVPRTYGGRRGVLCRIL